MIKSWTAHLAQNGHIFGKKIGTLTPTSHQSFRLKTLTIRNFIYIIECLTYSTNSMSPQTWTIIKIFKKWPIIVFWTQKKSTCETKNPFLWGYQFSNQIVHSIKWNFGLIRLVMQKKIWWPNNNQLRFVTLLWTTQ